MQLTNAPLTRVFGRFTSYVVSGAPLGAAGPFLVWFGYRHYAWSLLATWLAFAIEDWWSDRVSLSAEGVRKYDRSWTSNLLTWDQLAKCRIGEAADGCVGFFTDESAFAILALRAEVAARADVRAALAKAGRQFSPQVAHTQMPIKEKAVLAVLICDVVAIAVGFY